MIRLLVKDAPLRTGRFLIVGGELREDNDSVSHSTVYEWRAKDKAFARVTSGRKAKAGQIRLTPAERERVELTLVGDGGARVQVRGLDASFAEEGGRLYLTRAGKRLAVLDPNGKLWRLVSDRERSYDRVYVRAVAVKEAAQAAKPGPRGRLSALAERRAPLPAAVEA